MHRERSAWAALGRFSNRALPLGAVALCAGCSMTKLAVSTQAEIMEKASPTIEEQTDYEFARTGIPGNLIQTEGLLRVSPDDPHLLLLAAWGFASYAYGFVEDDKERAEEKGDLDAADQARARARAMYLKGRDFGLRLLELETPKLKDVLQRDPDALKKFLTEELKDPEDAPALFWTGYAWGSAIGVSRDDPTLIADLALASTLVERSVELDEKYYNAAGHVFLGVVNSSRGASVGGNPELGKQHFERALALTGRKALLAHVNYAQYYAVQSQNRKLFDALLNEVVNAPIPEHTTLALPNTIAHRRAVRLLRRGDDLILPPLPDLPPDGPQSEEAPGAVTPAAAPPTPATAAAPAAAKPEPAKPASAAKAATPPKPPSTKTTAAPKEPTAPTKAPSTTTKTPSGAAK